MVPGFQSRGNGGGKIVFRQGLPSSFLSKNRHSFALIGIGTLSSYCSLYLLLFYLFQQWPKELAHKLCYDIYQICYQFLVWDGLAKCSKYFSSNTEMVYLVQCWHRKFVEKQLLLYFAECKLMLLLHTLDYNTFWTNWF